MTMFDQPWSRTNWKGLDWTRIFRSSKSVSCAEQRVHHDTKALGSACLILQKEAFGLIAHLRTAASS
jgi:hypothetical protein